MMRRELLTVLGMLLALSMLATKSQMAQAVLLASDDFDYTGALTDNGWGAHSGAGNLQMTSNGDYTTLEQVPSGTSGEDDNLPFAEQSTTATTYASFDFRLPSDTNMSSLGSGGLYFAHYRPTSGFNYRARTGVLKSNGGGGDFRLAIDVDDSDLSDGAIWSSELDFGTWYNVVISYDASTGNSQMWLNPTGPGDTSVTDTGSSGETTASFALRQAGGYAGYIDIDNVKVGMSFSDVSVPEPAGIILAMVAGLFTTSVRRRRQWQQG